MKNEARMLIRVSISSLLQCFDTSGSMAGVSELVSWCLTSLFSTNISLYQARKVRGRELSLPSIGRPATCLPQPWPPFYSAHFTHTQSFSPITNGRRSQDSVLTKPSQSEHDVTRPRCILTSDQALEHARKH